MALPRPTALFQAALALLATGPHRSSAAELPRAGRTAQAFVGPDGALAAPRGSGPAAAAALAVDAQGAAALLAAGGGQRPAGSHQGGDPYASSPSTVAAAPYPSYVSYQPHVQSTWTAPAPAPPGLPCLVPMWGEDDFACREYEDYKRFGSWRDSLHRLRVEMPDGTTCTVKPPGKWGFWMAAGTTEMMCEAGAWVDGKGKPVAEIEMKAATWFLASSIAAAVLAVYVLRKMYYDPEHWLYTWRSGAAGKGGLVAAPARAPGARAAAPATAGAISIHITNVASTAAGESGERQPQPQPVEEGGAGKSATGPSGAVAAQEAQARSGPSPGLLYCLMFSAVLVPDLVATFVYSAAGVGTDIYEVIASDHWSMLGNCAAIASACWWMVMFVFDMFDSDTWRRGTIRSAVRFLCFSILVLLAFVGFTLKAVKLPWAPLLLCMAVTVCLLALQRVWCSGQAAGIPHFYLAAAACYTVCAVAVLAVWVRWAMSADEPRFLWWNADTKRWLANKYAMVFRVLTPVELATEASTPELQDYCLNKTSIHNTIASTITQDLVTGACGRAFTVIFTQWAGPLMVFACNMLGVGLCLLFSNTMTAISARSEDVPAHDKKKALLAFMKRFLLTIVLAVAIMYISLYVSSAGVKLSSAMLALACTALLVMFLWLAWEVDGSTLNELKEMPLMKHVINVLQSNWVKAIAVGGMNVMIPLILALDRVRQQVRKSCTNYYGTERWTRCPEEERAIVEADQHTPEGRWVRGFLDTWDWTDIFGKVCVLAEVFVLLAVGSKATFIFFSYLNGEIETAGLEIGTIFVMVWAIGLAMFMNPVVPGSAVYLFAGVVLGAQSQKEGSVGIWAGLALACVAGSSAKLMACLGQYTLGYVMGKSVKVQHFVGVTKVGVLAMEAVLKEEGFKLFKVCILVAGPDFPTSVLCGILQLNIPQMILGTLPVVFVSIIPQTLVGVLLTKEGATEGVWSMIATVATGLAAVFQAGATLVFAYGIMQRVEESGDELLKVHRPEHDEVRKLAEKDAEYVKKYGESSAWGQLGTGARATLLGTVALFLLSGLLIALDTLATEKACFRDFYITDKIESPYDEGGLNGKVLSVVLAPRGWIALGLAAAAAVLHVGFGRWLAATARAALEAPGPAAAPGEAAGAAGSPDGGAAPAAAA